MASDCSVASGAPVGVAGRPRCRAPAAAQCPRRFEVAAGRDFYKFIGEIRRRGALLIDHDECAIGAAARHKLAHRIERVTFQVPRVTGERIDAPVDDEVGPMTNLAQRRRRFADLLQRHDRPTRTERRGGIDRGPNRFCEPHRRALARRAAARQAPNKRVARTRQNFGRVLQGVVDRSGLPVDLCDGRLRCLLRKQPRLGECASPLRLHNAPAIDGQSQIVANATARGAGDVFVDLSEQGIGLRSGREQNCQLFNIRPALNRSRGRAPPPQNDARQRHTDARDHRRIAEQIASARIRSSCAHRARLRRSAPAAHCRGPRCTSRPLPSTWAEMPVFAAISAGLRSSTAQIFRTPDACRVRRSPKTNHRC